MQRLAHRPDWSFFSVEDAGAIQLLRGNEKKKKNGG
jgi:hypothetical protein